MTGPIYVTSVAVSPMPRRLHLGRWHWEIRDGGPNGRLLAEGHAWRKRRAIDQREKARARCKRRYAHVQPRQPISPAKREYALALINACLVDYDRGMRNADPETLRHEAERLEAEPSSPVVKSMRLIVDGVRTARAEAVSAR